MRLETRTVVFVGKCKVNETVIKPITKTLKDWLQVVHLFQESTVYSMCFISEGSVPVPIPNVFCDSLDLHPTSGVTQGEW